MTSSRQEVSMHATVTQASPLRVRVDGSDSDAPARKLNAASYLVNDRVAVLVRTPLPPLVLGKET